jgi:hypothetical protein
MLGNNMQCCLSFMQSVDRLSVIMVCVTYAVCHHLSSVSLMMCVTYAMSHMLCVTYAVCHLCCVSLMLYVTFAVCHLC